MVPGGQVRITVTDPDVIAASQDSKHKVNFTTLFGEGAGSTTTAVHLTDEELVDLLVAVGNRLREKVE
jgi:class 3 adenylate cyclase